MSNDKLNQHAAAAQEALRTFLTTLLGAEAPLRIEEPTPADFEDANMRSKTSIVFSAGTAPANRWVVVLDPAWLPVLSKSMLGEPIGYGEPGADDLLKEVADQAYGALRTRFGSENGELFDAEVNLLPRETDLVRDQFASVLYKAPFSLSIQDQELLGIAIIPASASESTEMPVEELDFDLSEFEEPEERSPQPTVEVAPASFPDLGNESIGDAAIDTSFSLLAEVELEVTVELGRRKIPLADVLRLTTGSVIELEKLVGEPLEVYANGRLIAEGEAVVMDEQFGIRITSLATNRQRAKAFV